MILPAVGEISPLNFELFDAELTHHPDRAKVNFVLEGVKDGFRLGCDKPVTLKSANNYGIDNLLHYLDNFILATPANPLVCASNLQVAVSVVARLGLPLHPQNCLGPASCIVVLGIELDTAAQIARLPADKFSTIQEVLSHGSTRKCCTKKDLQSLIGRLHHACMVVWSGQTFLRRMIDLLSCFVIPP